MNKEKILIILEKAIAAARMDSELTAEKFFDMIDPSIVKCPDCMATLQLVSAEPIPADIEIKFIKH